MPTTSFKEVTDFDIHLTYLLDWTGGDGPRTQASLESKLSYVGVCFTEKHTKRSGGFRK